VLGERLLTVKQAAEFLGVSRNTLYRYENRGFLVPLRTPTGHRRYRRSDLEDFLHKMEVRGGGAARVPAKKIAGSTLDG
jgi:excisionase family DNA binding protein